MKRASEKGTKSVGIEAGALNPKPQTRFKREKSASPEPAPTLTPQTLTIFVRTGKEEKDHFQGQRSQPQTLTYCRGPD